MEEQITENFSDKEKIFLAKQIYLEGKNESNTIGDLSKYFLDSFQKIDGFDYRWNSLITSNPLLFEDVDYVRCRGYVNNTITEEEIQAYKSGNLRELYATFENMLVCNLQYYDRIMNFCTMVFMHYVRLSEDEITSENLKNIPYIFDMTPTQIWCCAMSNINSTVWELNYGWKINGKEMNLSENVELSPIQYNWNKLYQNNIFSKFIEYCAFRCGTTGFRETLLHDKTGNKKLSQVCSKFTRTSTAITDTQLNSLYDYINEIERINQKLYDSLYSCMKRIFNNDDTQFGIYVFGSEFYIHSSKFSMKVSKDITGKISKDYLANSYECFAAEEYLSDSIKTQIEWAKYRVPLQFDYDKQILITLLKQMLKENYHDILCIKRMNEYGILSKIKFAGVFNNIYIIEELMFDNRCIKSSRICLSKENAAQYVINRGYYIIGKESDVYDLSEITRKSIVNHYTNYCIPILKHMSSIITLHTLSKNDIIDVVCSGILNPNKINNKNIKYTNVKTQLNPRQLMSNMFLKQNTNSGRKSYWKAIE